MTTAQAEILKNFAGYLHQIGYSETTRYEVAYCVNEFLETIKKEILTIEQTDILDFYEYLQQRPLKQKTGTLSANMITHYVYGLKVFFNWLEQTGQLLENPISSLKFKRPDYHPREPLSQSEIQTLFEAAATAREKAILHLFYSCGLRRSEAEELNTSDIHFSKNLLYVREGKGAKRRVVPINEKVKKGLENYLENERPKISEQAFVLNRIRQRMRGDGYNRILKEIIKRTEINPDTTLHHLRHSIATHLLENGLKIELVRDFLGHAHLETTQIYAKVKAHQLSKL
jgi:integrase/recombinase XerD